MPFLPVADFMSRHNLCARKSPIFWLLESWRGARQATCFAVKPPCTAVCGVLILNCTTICAAAFLPFGSKLPPIQAVAAHWKLKRVIQPCATIPDFLPRFAACTPLFRCNNPAGRQRIFPFISRKSPVCFSFWDWATPRLCTAPNFALTRTFWNKVSAFLKPFASRFKAGKRRADNIRPYEKLRPVGAYSWKRIATGAFAPSQ